MVVQLVWVLNFVLSWTKATISAGVSAYYFTRDKSTIPNGYVTRQFRELFIYQAG
jgi:hypothetical protein